MGGVYDSWARVSRRASLEGYHTASSKPGVRQIQDEREQGSARNFFFVASRKLSVASLSPRGEVTSSPYLFDPSIYNLFNTVNLCLPVVDIASSGFGRIGSQAVPAREWQFGIKVFY
jgi:hypothetical protein